MDSVVNFKFIGDNHNIYSMFILFVIVCMYFFRLTPQFTMLKHGVNLMCFVVIVICESLFNILIILLTDILLVRYG